MNTKIEIPLNTDKIVSVRVRRKNDEGNELYFLFTTPQIEEVLTDITVTPVPFSPSFLTGLYNWRGKIVPVISLEKRLGFSDTDESSNRFLVIRTGTSTDSTNGEILRCVLRISDKIHTKDTPTFCTTISANRLGVDPPLLRGAYQGEQDSYLIPNLAYILQNQQSTNIF
jgi:chemotaxis signal transduction protein